MTSHHPHTSLSTTDFLFACSLLMKLSLRVSGCLAPLLNFAIVGLSFDEGNGEVNSDKLHYLSLVECWC